MCHQWVWVSLFFKSNFWEHWHFDIEKSMPHTFPSSICLQYEESGDPLRNSIVFALTTFFSCRVSYWGLVGIVDFPLTILQRSISSINICNLHFQGIKLEAPSSWSHSSRPNIAFMQFPQIQLYAEQMQPKLNNLSQVQIIPLMHKNTL